MYVESRKMVQMNLVAGQEQRHRENGHVAAGGKGEGGVNWQINLTHIHHHIHIVAT